MRRAYLGLRKEPVYRRDAFADGLGAAGLSVTIGPPQTFTPDTVYVCWGRHGENASLCDRVERAGGVCLVAENGYLNVGGSSPHGDESRGVYALARSHHNDDRAIPAGDGDRWSALMIHVKPWREDGGHVLVCPNRSFGEPGRIMPLDWAEQTVKALRRFTKREIRIRGHPGNKAPQKPLAEDLAGAHAVVIWHSSAGVHALIAGVPVICMGPRWIMKSAAGLDLSQLENPPMPDRMSALHRLAAGQFFLSEIESGAAFRRVLADCLHPA